MRIHHFGMVVSDIKEAAPRVATSLGLHWDGRIIEDPIQTVRVSFLGVSEFSLVSPETPMLELVEPSSPNSRVASFLTKGGGIHHVCYEVPDLVSALAQIRRGGAIVIQMPVPAVAFNQRLIAWIYTKDRLLVELLSMT